MIKFYIALVVLAICLFFKYQLSYWVRRKIDGPAPLPLFGSLFDFVTKRRHLKEIYDEIYDAYPKARYVGFYKMSSKALIIRDLDLVKSILVTNFSTFNKNDFTVDPKLDPLLAYNPFIVPGDDWKTARSMLTPLFTANRLRSAFPLINEITKKLMEYIEGGPESNSKDGFEMKELCAKYTTDVVALLSFGMDGESFTNPEATLRKIGDEVFKPTFLNAIRQTIVLFMPFLNKIMRVPFVSQWADNEFRGIVDQLVELREKDKTEKNDLLAVILQLREKHGKDIFSRTAIVGHSMTFLTEGYETSSTTMSFALYELATNPSIQRKVQAEIDSIFSQNNAQITEESVNKMEYLDRVLMESLRIHSTVFALTKVNLTEFELPPQYENSTKNLTVEPGTIFVIPVYAIQCDPENYSDPHKFNPDNFLKENVESRHKYSYLSFGEGPRICLGMKLALAQSKAGVAKILSKYNVSLSSKTDQPLKIAKGSFVLAPENGIYLHLTKRTDVK